MSRPLMDPRHLLQFLREHRFGVEASVALAGGPQAAVVGLAVTDRFEIVFDTLASSRKVQNLRRNPKLAFVIGGLTGGDERTVQYEGLADEPSGAELVRLTQDYYRVFPDGPGRLHWPGLTYVRVTPTWIRYSDYNVDPPRIVEFAPSDLVI